MSTKTTRKRKRVIKKVAPTAADHVVDRLAECLIDDLMDSAKRLVPKLQLLTAIDPELETMLDTYKSLQAVNTFAKKRCRLSLDDAAKRKIRTRVGALSREPSPLKFMKQEVKAELCVLAERVQLIRALDPSFDEQLAELGARATFDRAKRAHRARAHQRKRDHRAGVKKFEKEAKRLAAQVTASAS